MPGPNRRVEAPLAMCCVCHVVLRDGVLREPACGGRARREAGAEGRRAGRWLGHGVRRWREGAQLRSVTLREPQGERDSEGTILHSPV